MSEIVSERERGREIAIAQFFFRLLTGKVRLGFVGQREGGESGSHLELDFTKYEAFSVAR